MIISYIVAALLLGAQAQELSPTPVLPAFLSLAPNLNDFGRFADGGPDENWYIGFNNAWIVQLPPAPLGGHTRAFLGAKIGRAKTQPRSDNSWEREAIPGKIYIAVSPTPAFSAERSFYLAETADIPLEPDARFYIPGAGPSQWFWTEIPVGLISASGPNYVIIWSPTENFKSSSNSPILAAMEDRSGSAELRAWNNRSIGGVAPRRQEGTLETPIRNLKPALAIKLVPRNESSVFVRHCATERGPDGIVFRFSVAGENIQSAWLETSTDQLDWERFTSMVSRPPFEVTIPRSQLPPRGGYFRATARDELGNEGSCAGLFLSREKP